ncbi:MAG: hypothetical protein OCD02_22080 [Spirochaetaceae bacterium]
MSDKKNIILAALVFILFFLLFPLKLQNNLSYFSDESIELSGTLTSLPGEKIPYIFGDRAGYFSTDLKNAWGIDIHDGVTLLDDGYINYKRSEKTLNYTNLKGIAKYKIEDDGYPFSINNRLFILGRDRKSISEIVYGEIRWTKNFNYIITTVDANEKDLVIGFMKGEFVVLDETGDLFFEYEVGGSRVSVIYSTSISTDGNCIAIVSGLDPQRFILYQRKELEFKPIFSMNLKDEVRRSPKLFITSNDNNIFIEGSDGFYVVDYSTKESSFIAADYPLKNVKYLEALKIYMIHTGTVNYNNLKLVTTDHRVLLEKSFVGDGVSIKALDHSVYVVIDNSVIKLDIKE